MTRGSWYGNQDGVDRQTYEEWVKPERARMRAVMRRRRARLRAQRAERTGEPGYPEPVLALMERWIDGHAAPGWECELEQVVFYMRKAGRAAGEDFDVIQDRGVAKYLRSLGFRLRRAAAGMVVIGIKGAV
jgi:hypothetical protein